MRLKSHRVAIVVLSFFPKVGRNDILMCLLVAFSASEGLKSFIFEQSAELMQRMKSVDCERVVDDVV